jgi:hypothetical protein
VTTPTVLFLCPHNALRSVVAAVREVRGLIQARVERLLAELAAPRGAP